MSEMAWRDLSIVAAAINGVMGAQFYLKALLYFSRYDREHLMQNIMMSATTFCNLFNLGRSASRSKEQILCQMSSANTPRFCCELSSKLAQKYDITEEERESFNLHRKEINAWFEKFAGSHDVEFDKMSITINQESLRAVAKLVAGVKAAVTVAAEVVVDPEVCENVDAFQPFTCPAI